MQVLFLLLSTAVAVNARCGTGFIQGPSLSDCYKFVANGADWYGAEWRCQSLGGHLASVNSAFASSFLKEEVPSCSSGYYWLGGSNDDHNATWEWSDGTPFSYSNWDARQPVTGSSLCLAASTTSGKWSAQLCNQSRPYVCRVPATGDVSPTPTPPCNDNSRASGVCICGTEICVPHQFCHLNLYPKCYSNCPESGPVLAPGCQCATASANGDICTAGQHCQSNGTCWTPPPTCTNNALVTTPRCKCATDTCNKGQFCHEIGETKCVDKCAAVGPVTGTYCQCTAPWNVGNVCSVGETCKADGTCPNTCVVGGPAPAGGCECTGTTNNANFCNVGQACQADGTCLDTCTDNAKSSSTCACGDSACTANQYCHTTNNPKCLDVCTFGGVVSGTACQCVPATGGGVGSICTNGSVCWNYGICYSGSS